VKKYSAYIANLQATRKEKSDRLQEIHDTAAADGRTKTEDERAEFVRLEAEVKSIDEDIASTRRLQAIADADEATAEPADDTQRRSAVAGGDRGRVQTVGLSVKEQLKPGIAFARYAMLLVAAKGNHALAYQMAMKHYPKTEAVVMTLKAQSEGVNLQSLMQQKATIAAGTTTDATWAGPLVYAETFMGDFIEYLRPRTLIGQAQFRPIPFNVRVLSQTSGGTANWVGQGKAKPLTKYDFAATTVPFTKVAAISVITQELARFSSPAAEGMVRDQLAETVIAKIDSDLFDPAVAAVSNVNPAGLLNGVSPVVGPPKTGVDAEDVRCALLRLWAPWDSTNIGARPAYYTTPAVARYLAFMRDPLGQQSFPGMTPQGGTLNGVPVRVSNYLANAGGSGGAPLILVDEAEIWLADDGQVALDMSDQASLEMSDAPAQNSTSPTAAQMVSMWQTNSIALRAERFIWWQARRSGAVQWIDGFPVAC
jgi:HK97 family phage major capsid protein